jgi:nitrogen fixation protein NifB
MAALRVAVASTDGITVNEHFGRAKKFYIYEVTEEGQSRLVEERAIAPQAADAPEPAHGSDVTVEQLTDVNAVLVSQIGPGAESLLSRNGVRSFALGGPVDRALTSYGRRHKLLDTKIPGMPAGYSAEKRCGCSSKSKGGCK